MTDIIIFSGPTVSAEGARALLPGADCRGPASCGDILRAAAEAPRAIGLIDGYFEHRLSVWHKEILWALSRGIAVYGASSMGALRAAELAAFGMIGVGEVFEAYLTGVLEDDDEVAVTHASPDFAYRPLSEAMVNLRATLAAAVDQGAISPNGSAAVIAALKARFYPERDQRALVQMAHSVLTEPEAAAFSSWFSGHGMVNQKLLDAEALLRRMASDADADQFVLQRGPAIEFPHTNAWQALLEQVEESPTSAALPVRALESSGPAASAVLADLRVQNEAVYDEAWRIARERAFAVSLAQSRGVVVGTAQVQEEADRVRRALGLWTLEATAQWLSDNDLDVAGFSQLVGDGLLARELSETMARAVEGQLPDALRILGEYKRRPILPATQLFSDAGAESPIASSVSGDAERLGLAVPG